LSVTADEHYRAPFQPLVPGVSFASADDLDAIDRLVDEETAAIVVEPIQGEGGVRPLARASADAIMAACRRSGALVIADEIQSGSGRTGTFLHSGAVGLSPDLVALGKALGGGMPVGAALLRETVAKTIAPGDHGTTYGGNLLACRAALTFLEVLDDDLLASIRRVGAYLFDRLRSIAADSGNLVAEIRGAGLIAGLDLRVDATPVVQAALERGLIVNRTSGTVVRLLPPFIVTEHDVDEAASILKEALRAAG
jgi:acetylornithine/succinyldiaminopimelate/putrescine aminotransferase